MSHHVLGMLEDRARVQKRLKVETLSVAVVGRMLSSIEKTSWRRPETTKPGRRRALAQAAFESSWCTLACEAPLMAIRRGFMASGISRTSSILSRPLSNDAFLTWT
jgi:hypothetical protein